MQFSKCIIVACMLFSVSAWSQNNESGQRLKIRAYLEGALINNGNSVSDDGRPLMRDNLRVSPYNNLNYLPVSDPYKTIISDVDLKMANAHVGAGLNDELSTITNPDEVFGVSGENAIVDWIFVEIRKADNSSRVITTRSCLIQRDGDLVDLDGISDVWFPDLVDETFYVAIRHRNHLGAMSKIVTSSQLIDFTAHMTQLFDFGTQKVDGLNFVNMSQKTDAIQAYKALWAGDFNADCKIKFAIPNDDLTTAFYEQDFTGSGYAPGYYQGDFDMNSVVTFTGNNNDAFLLEMQAKNYNLNPSQLPNFNYFIEQIPSRN
ncbi:MAG: hypothetical protein WAT79_02645 [Saprospiraceae bacterium]